MTKYIEIEDLEVYKLAVEISQIGWDIYRELNYQLKKIIGDQFIQAIDSIGANIAEGYGRYHYLDKIKFYYNARGSIFEACYWVVIMKKREIGDQEKLEKLKELLDKENMKLNNFISSTYKAKDK